MLGATIRSRGLVATRCTKNISDKYSQSQGMQPELTGAALSSAVVAVALWIACGLMNCIPMAPGMEEMGDWPSLMLTTLGIKDWLDIAPM